MCTHPYMEVLVHPYTDLCAVLTHIVYQQPSYLLHMKPKSFIWDHFVVVETKPNGAPKTVHCKHDGCQYRKAANPNRMLQHWQADHLEPQESPDGLEEDAEEVVLDFVDAPLGGHSKELSHKRSRARPRDGGGQGSPPEQGPV